MKTLKTAVAAFMAVLAVISCNSGLSGSRGTTVKGANERSDRSQRTILDAAKYVDFTLKGTNASMFTKQDLLFELNGTYRIAGGNSYITIDRQDGTVTISSDDAWHEDSGGHNLYARYVFDVQAASEDCLYLKMGGKRQAQMIMDYKTLVNQAVPDLAVCLPLYGYSRNRIEVSPVMDGFIAMPSGTYWAVRK